MSQSDDFMNMFMGVVGLDKTPYYCVKCHGQVEVIPAKTMLEKPRKLFFCRNNHCERFGIVTVVVRKT
jgi:hypothetical protein